MTEDLGIFPFGQPVRKVEQVDRSLKKAFVLGVYASAVHAKWIGPHGKQKVQALAVASEPVIFWRGDGADEIIGQIEIPSQVGRLMPARAQFSGPSAIALDEKILHPLSLTREDTWLCDLAPRSFMNEDQDTAIKRAYLPLMDEYGLPMPTVPTEPRTLTDEKRRKEIMEEIKESGAGVLILLGDKPVEWFLRYYDQRWPRLRDFGTTPKSYGKLHQTSLDGTAISVLPVAHPRQVAKLGRSSDKWYRLHQSWLQDGASHIEFA